MKHEALARSILILGVALAFSIPIIGKFFPRVGEPSRILEVHARMPESGGWDPDHISIHVGESLKLRFTSEDVVHGFAIGKLNQPSVEIHPGEVTEITLTFDHPGTYMFYCTRWCGPNHWRMRGILEVTGESAAPTPEPQPLYLQLGLDLDAPHLAEVIPTRIAMPERGAQYANQLPAYALDRNTYLTTSPARLWMQLRAEPTLASLSDDELWDVVAWIWQRSSSAQAWAEGQQLYSANCAACHGETGKGDGVMVRSLPAYTHENHLSGMRTRPPDFSDPRYLLGASPALLEGKIIRGGMGTGMPYWSPIFTQEQIEALIAYIYHFAWYGSNPTSPPVPPSH